MEGAEQTPMQSPENGIPLAGDSQNQRKATQSPHWSPRSRTHIHKPAALQVNESVPTSSSNATHDKLRSPTSPTARESASDSQYSPKSPPTHWATGSGRPNSSQDVRSGLGSVSVDSDTERTEGTYTRSVAASPLKAHSYSQLRNVSSPFPQAAQLGNSSPPSPRSTTSPPPLAASSHLEARPMPRTSSIDSAISAIYPGALHSHKPSQESGAEIPDISNLIKAAGSSEILIQHLLKEKQHSAARETQLWRLVDKQRSLVLGLNDDLEKALKDKERYRKKVREHLDKVPPIPTPTPRAPTPQTVATSRSPSPSKASADLPIQGQRSEHALSTDCHETVPTFVPTTDSTGRSAAPLSGPTSKRLERLEDDEWVRSKKRMQGSKHSHKATSSSDVGVLGPINPAPSVAPIQTSSLHNPTETDKLGSQSQTSPALRPVVSPSSSFAAKRSHPQTNKPLNVPNLVLAESTPTNNDFERMTPPRKAPPAPLDLGQQRRDISARSQSGLEEHSQTDYDEDIEVDELPILERGRKKTREDDDREREAASLKEKQDRSRSKKDKTSGSRTTSAKSKAQESRIDSQPQTVPFTPSIKSFSPDTVPIGGSSYLSPPTSLAGVLNPSESLDEYSITERVTLAKPMSPGLPLSPRPNHRPMNPPTPRLPRDGTGPSIASPPISPRDGFIGLPLSPRAPSQPIPLPPHTPASLIDSPPQYMDSNGDDAGSSKETYSPSKSPSDTVQHRIETPLPSRNAESGPKARGVFQGFISEAYPGLLLPPNALPSILVRVVSSRLKPSRHSLVIKGSEEEPVFTLGISARSDRQGLWQVEKPMQSLQQLDQQLRQSSAIAVKHPDRSLFSGHAPAKVDARRIALEKYFETLLDTQMDERTALTLCHYLSTQVSEMDEESDGVTIGQSPGSPTTHGPDGKLFKQGYLTKRGKNFGGWKARYFVLNEPVLRYYETPGGSLLGTIKIHSAQIGKQNKPSHSPTREEADGQFRHAFLIREPKRKDSNNFIDHVLCAESDTERDAWVEALLCYVENARPDINSKPQISKTDSGKVIVLSKNSSKKDMVSSESPDSDGFDSLQAVPYENTQAAQAPLVQIIPDPRPTESPSPTTSGSQPSLRAPSAQSKAISAPQNGIKISDVGAWGNKPIAPPLNHPKEQKKRGIWGFRDRNAADLGTNHSNESNLSLTQQQYQEQITNVKAAFGATLAEAVEFCGPRGIDACLPAVVYRCLEYLEMKDAPSEEGIFRMSGSNTLIKSLRNRFNAEGDLDLLGDDQPYYDVHAVASLLKLYLRELPQPVLTRELHLQFLSVLDLPDKSDKLKAYNILVNKLPKPNFTLLRALSNFLITVISNSEVNKMSIRNVGIVFSPTLNIPAPVFSMFLTDFDAIFVDAPENASIPSLEVTSNEPLTPEDIRSPRRQMFSDIPTPSYAQDTFSTNVHQSSKNDQQGTTSRQILHNDTGFAPLQPTYDTTVSPPESITVPGPEYAVARPRNLAPGGAAKARRRESSMLLMGSGQRKGSLPMMRTDAGGT